MPATGVYRSMPPEVRQLADPWQSVAAQVPGLTAPLEADFRFGKRVVLFAPNEYRIGGSLKGGASTMWFPTDEAHHKLYREWHRLQGFGEWPDEDAWKGLHALLADHRIELQEPAPDANPDHYRRRRGPLYRMTWEILKRLPAEHLAADRFAHLQLGGSGPDNAKGSAYDGDTVIMYSFALEGARRTYYGLLLHELGHVAAAGFSPAAVTALTDAHAVLRRHNTFLGVEFLLGAASREQYQSWPVGEFLAETYLHYVACGSLLRNFLKSRPQPEVREAWERIYDRFLDHFDGLEYL